MFKETKKGISFFILGLIFLAVSVPFTITGRVILENYKPYFSFSSILGLIFIVISFVFLVAKKSLDAIVIPTGGGEWDSQEDMYSNDRDRAKKALENKDKLEDQGYFVISGYKGGNRREISKGQSYSIYKFLRGHGIKPSQIMVEGKSHDSLENVIYTLRKIKKREQKQGDEKPWDVAFVSYSGHLNRFEDFKNRASKKGIVREDEFRLHKIRTVYSDKEKKYESNPLRKIRHMLKLLTIGKYKLKRD